MICIHGAGGTSAEFIGLGEYLAEYGYRTVAFDFPGHGFTRLQPVADSQRLAFKMRVMAAIMQKYDGPKVMFCSSGGAIHGNLLLQNAKKHRWLAELSVIYAEPSFIVDDITRVFSESTAPFLLGRFATLDQAVECWDETQLGLVAFKSETCKRRYISDWLTMSGDALVVNVDRGEMRRVLEEAVTIVKSGGFNALSRGVPVNNRTLFIWGEFGTTKAKVEKILPDRFRNYSSVDVKKSAHPLSMTCDAELVAVRDFIDDV
ncbi:hypothetical protein BOW53_12850 [Solemya pervernicosa gill symbiont]|uniref:AB hydrolase-1 domain-containing protein n=1 Tax=Solemya pervernicosa gill symbiont TaxID=642797 RepID=A0A1T2L255_9GAMM|nr:hypothetical protein BOW53_12850 [Solemya pervernicosa gill symbiont]